MPLYIGTTCNRIEAVFSSMYLGLIHRLTSFVNFSMTRDAFAGRETGID